MKTILAGTPSPALPARTQHYASGQRQGSTALAGLNHRVRNVLQIVGVDALLNTYSNRQTEKLLESFNGFHFFLGKDNVREVVVTR